MGRDKALLPFRGGVLACHIASVVAEAAGSVTLIGDPQKYSHLGYRVWPDRRASAGPAGGIEAALYRTTAAWNLVVACDMPSVSAEFLRDLLDAAERLNPDALLPAGPSGRLEPLSAVYHRRAAAAFTRALDSGIRKVTDVLAGLRIVTWNVNNALCLRNVNTPEDWAADDAR